MRQFSIAALAMMASAMQTGPVVAVDIINGDDIVHDVIVEIAGTLDILEVGPGDILKNVCRKCILSIEDGETLDVEGDQAVVIEGGELRLERAGN